MELEKRIKQILNELNVNIRNKGYRCWIEAIKYVIENKKVSYSMTKEVYPCVADKLNDTTCRVERALRHATEDNQERIQDYFKVQYKITNGTLLALIVDKLESED